MEVSEKLSKEDVRRGISFPDKNESLAEFLGILSGDGYMNEYPKRQEYVIEISGNKIKDYDYLNEFVFSLINRLFNVKPSLHKKKNENTVVIKVSSKGVFHFLKELEFPSGRKGEIISPSWIIENKILFKRFIRGFFDTDGYVCLKNKEGKKYPVLGMTSKSKSLVTQFKQFLNDLNISSCIVPQKNFGERYQHDSMVYKLQISGKKNIGIFFSQIGSNNSRNLNKLNEIFY